MGTIKKATKFSGFFSTELFMYSVLLDYFITIHFYQSNKSITVVLSDPSWRYTVPNSHNDNFRATEFFSNFGCHQVNYEIKLFLVFLKLIKLLLISFTISFDCCYELILLPRRNIAIVHSGSRIKVSLEQSHLKELLRKKTFL